MSSFSRPGLAGLLALAALTPVAAAGPYDGTYSGKLVLVGNGAMACAKAAPVQMIVADGKLEYHHFSNAVFKDVVIAPDGSFSGTTRNVYGAGQRQTPTSQQLTGRVSTAGIEADTKTEYCTYHLTLTRMR